MSAVPPKPDDYWKDEKHSLRFTLLDAAGFPIHEIPQWRIPAPVNKNTQATISLQIEIVEKDNCSQVIQVISIQPY